MQAMQWNKSWLYMDVGGQSVHQREADSAAVLV